MDLTGSANDLDRLDPGTWSVLVGAASGDEDAELISQAVEPIFIGIGTGTLLYRASGLARTRSATLLGCPRGDVRQRARLA